MRETLPRWLERFINKVILLPRAHKRLLMVLADICFIPAALWCAVTLRFGTPDNSINGLEWLYPAAIFASIPVFTRLGLYRAIVRFIGSRAMMAVLAGVSTSVVILFIASFILASNRLPISAVVIYWALALIYVGGSRFAVRSVMNYRRSDSIRRVAIYGAGEAGAQLVAGLMRSGRFHAVGFVDDNPSLHASIINGIEVFPPSMLPELIVEDGVSAVLLALPSLSRRRRQEILKQLEPLGVLIQTIPDYSTILSGRATVDDIKDVDASDLLGRDAVPPNERLLDACIRGKVVMVTGAGGSIGSELCRQILRLAPAQLLLFEMSELALYSVDKELRLLAIMESRQVDIVALLGNAHHKNRMKEILQGYGVQTVYHAAAYKHVPIVEQNIVEGIYNNIFSTWHAAEAALECRVETFVLVSTDKAVNPTNVMGATKRFAEIVLQGLAERGAQTRFCMVRFGNVLESSGSVVPLFREQIKRGGPVTVTHKDVIRFFMTIPEASQLVLQAGSMAKGGDVFVLNMGKPVRIDDLARRMIGLMGLTVRELENPDGDIEITYTGLRPAEKLFEELLIGSNVTGTEHPMIMRAMEHSLPWSQVKIILEELRSSLDLFDCVRARELLIGTVAEYRPETDIQDLVWQRSAVVAGSRRKVADLREHRVRQSRPVGS